MVLRAKERSGLAGLVCHERAPRLIPPFELDELGLSHGHIVSVSRSLNLHTLHLHSRDKEQPKLFLSLVKQINT